MTGPKASTALQVAAVLFLFIACKAAGNLSLAWGMKHFPQSIPVANPISYIRAIFDPFVASGIVALVLAVLIRMVLLSRADLSYVLPVTAIGYVVAAFLGKTFLHEAVSGQRWFGTALIFVGAALAGTTLPSKTGGQTE
jgi:drug/metabolite transporter (DMT)-like permease